MQRILACAALTFGSCASPPQPPLHETMLRERHAALITTPNSLGSGFPISGSEWLTAWHVVEGWRAEQIDVDGWAVLKVIHLGDLDAAVLVTAWHGLEPWPLAARAARAGERVFKSGYGTGLHWWTEGIATEDPNRIAIDIFPGDSGGPVFNAEGEVLAMIVAVSQSQRRQLILHQAWVVPMTEIRALLEGLRAPVEPPPPAVILPETPWERFRRLKKERGL